MIKQLFNKIEPFLIPEKYGQAQKALAEGLNENILEFNSEMIVSKFELENSHYPEHLLEDAQRMVLSKMCESLSNHDEVFKVLKVDTKVGPPGYTFTLTVNIIKPIK